MDGCWDLIYSWGLTRSRRLEVCTWSNRKPKQVCRHLDWRARLSVTFDWNTKTWTASWKWASGHLPTELANRIQEYTVSDCVQDVYKEELSMWQRNGWLLAYPDKELGTPKELIALMTVVQEHKQKVWPVLDYQELNGFVEVFSANAEVCSQRLRVAVTRGKCVAYGPEKSLCTNLYWQSAISNSDRQR